MKRSRYWWVPPRWVCVLIWFGTVGLYAGFFYWLYAFSTGPRQPDTQNNQPVHWHAGLWPSSCPATYCGAWYDAGDQDAGQVLYLSDTGTYRLDTVTVVNAPPGTKSLNIKPQTGSWTTFEHLLLFDPPIPGWPPDVPDTDGSMMAGYAYVFNGVPQQTLWRGSRAPKPDPDDPLSAFFRRANYSPGPPAEWVQMYSAGGYAPTGYSTADH